jgi:hypothetical protein
MEGDNYPFKKENKISFIIIFLYIIQVIMSEMTIIQQILTSGLEGSTLIFLLVISYKVYKMKIKTKSNCCGDSFNLETENEGGAQDIPAPV